MWSLAGSQAVDQPFCCFGPESRGTRQSSCFGPELPGLAGPLCGLGSAVLGLWVGQLASAPCAHPPEVSGVDPHSANLGTRDGASGGLQGCLSRIHSPGAGGGGVSEAEAAAQSSLISH